MEKNEMFACYYFLFLMKITAIGIIGMKIMVTYVFQQLFILPSGNNNQGGLGTFRGNHSTPVRLTVIYMYRCESLIHGIDDLLSPLKDGIFS